VTRDALADIVEESRPVAERFVAAGHKIYLVGGIVRDLVVGRDLSGDLDLDLTTDATPDQTKAAIEGLADVLWLQGERFGTIGARINGRPYEITTHRSESYDPSSRKPVVQFSTAVEHDLSRRDFTVNAMAIDLPSQRLVDPFGGRADLDAQVLRTPLGPDLSFTDDPLRMLRAARFMAGYHLSPAPELEAAMAALADRIGIVAVERLAVELDKLLEVATPSPGLMLLQRTGLLTLLLPEIATDQLAQRARAVDTLPTDIDLRLAGLFYGANPADVARRLKALRYGNHRQRDVVAILHAAGLVASGQVATDASFRRWYRQAGPHHQPALVLAATLAPETQPYVAAVNETATALVAELDDLGPPLTGEQVMAALNVEPGPAVGQAMVFLQDLRDTDGPQSVEAATAKLQAWWASRSTA
jgi:poly(A) polymerase